CPPSGPGQPTAGDYTCVTYPNPFRIYATPETSFPGDLTWGYVDNERFNNWGSNPVSQQPGVVIWSNSLPYPPASVHLQEITDGTSNTILLGEYEPKYNERYAKWDEPEYSDAMGLYTPRYGGWIQSFAEHNNCIVGTTTPI